MAKETRLGDEAAIYQNREEKTEKQKFKEMNPHERIIYFKDYYLKATIIGIIVLCLAGYLLITIFTPSPDTVLSIAIVNDYLDADMVDTWKEDLEEYYSINPKTQKISIDDSYYIDIESSGGNTVASEQKLATYVYTNTLDIIIADEKTFKRYADNGYLIDLTDQLPTELYSYFSNSFFMEKAQEDTEENPYGIYIDNCNFYKNLGSVISKPVIGIIGSSPNKENSIELLKYLYDLN